MTRAIKTSLALLALSFALSGCASSISGGNVSASSFVSLADITSVKVASIYLKSKTSSISSGTATSSMASSSKAVSSSSSASSATTSDVAAAHQASFYSNEDYRYAVGTLSVLGHSDVSNGLYYLVNLTTLGGFLYTAASPLAAHRAKAYQLLKDDYAYLTSVYTLIQSYVGKSASELGFSSVSVTYANIASTVGYEAHTVLTESDKTTETHYYLTLDKVDGGYAFTDVIIRQSVTAKATGGILYTNNEYNLALVDSYSDMSFNLASYSLALAGTDLSAISSTGLTQGL
jgi:hypothetical protein